MSYWKLLLNLEPTDKCLEWAGAKDSSGHGVVKYQGKYWGTHRLSYLLNCGELEALWVLHKCNTPACINPRHLYLGTGKQNAADRQHSRGKYQPSGEACAWSKLTESDVLTIRWWWKYLSPKMTIIAENFQVSKGAISEIVYGKTWKHVT